MTKEINHYKFYGISQKKLVDTLTTLGEGESYRAGKVITFHIKESALVAITEPKEELEPNTSTAVVLTDSKYVGGLIKYLSENIPKCIGGRKITIEKI